MILSTVSLKGGAGKTTTAINLAVYFAKKGLKVVIVDSDVNKNIEKWNDLRGEHLPEIDCAVLNTENEFKQHFDGIAANYEIVIIDGRPAIDKLAGFILGLSDVAIFPVRPSPLDLWTFDDVFLPKYTAVKKVNKDLRAFFLLNMIKPNTNLAYECKLELIDYQDTTGIETLETIISDRTVYTTSLLDGLGVIESKNVKARAEIKILGHELENRIKL